MSTVVPQSSTSALRALQQPHGLFILPSFSSFSQTAVNTRGKSGERPRQRLCGLALRSLHHCRITINHCGCVACLFSHLLLVLANSQLTDLDKLVNDHVNGCAESVYFKTEGLWLYDLYTTTESHSTTAAARGVYSPVFF